MCGTHKARREIVRNIDRDVLRKENGALVERERYSIHPKITTLLGLWWNNNSTEKLQIYPYKDAIVVPWEEIK